MSRDASAVSENGSLSLDSGEDEAFCSGSDCSEDFQVDLSDFAPIFGWNDNNQSCKCSCVGEASSLTAVCSRDTLADDLSIPSQKKSELECGQSDRKATASYCGVTSVVTRSRSSSICREREETECTERSYGGHRDRNLPARSSHKDNDDEVTSLCPEIVEPRSRFYVRAVCKDRSLCKATQVKGRMLESQSNAPCSGMKTHTREACLADIVPVTDCLGDRETGEDGRVLSSCLVSTTRTGETTNEESECECTMDDCRVITPSSRVQRSGEKAARRANPVEQAGVDDDNATQSASQESCSCSCGAEQRRYQPVANSTRRRLATQLNIRISRLEPLGTPGPLKRPKRLHNPLEDGNCFFRAISFALTGRETHHRTLRNKVVGFMRHTISQQLESYLSLPVQDYVQDSRMATAGVWATDVEVMATAALLSVDIVVFRHCGGRRQWLTYPASFDLQRQSKESIYLQNSGGHFYLVTAT